MYSQIRLSGNSGTVEKEFTAKETELIKYLAAVRKMEKHIAGFTFRHIPRSENNETNELAKAAVQKAPMLADVFYQVLSVKAIREEEERPYSVHVIASKDWRSLIFPYPNGTYEPQSKHEIDRMSSRMKQYSIIAGELYKNGIVALMLKCISREQGIQLLSEMHAGMCGAHRGPHEIAHRAMRQGFYWPTVAEDAKELVRGCKGCQMFAKKQKAPDNPTKSIFPTWPL
jgi:hypothetical protein